MLCLSLQGSMAVGKTTALNYIKKNSPEININYENNSQVISEIKRRQLDKNCLQDYLEIQRLFISNEKKRYESAKKYNCTLMDFGAEEIAFYTLNYPKTIQKNWDIPNLLFSELKTLSSCFPQKILYLDASNATLLKRKNLDKTRSREFFDYYLTHLLPLKRKFFLKRNEVDILNVDCLSKEEVAKAVLSWVNLQKKLSACVQLDNNSMEFK